MRNKNKLLITNNIVTLKQKHIEQIELLIPAKVNPALVYEVRRKLCAVYALQIWLEQYHLPIAMEGLEHLNKDLFPLLCLPFTTDVKLGNFKTCVILCENDEEDILDIPAIAVDLPKLASHLYIFVSLREEETNVNDIDETTSVQANILGFVRYDQIQERKLDIDYDETLRSYGVPLASLEPSFSALHTCVRYVNPDKVVVPSSLKYPASGLVTARTIAEKITTLSSDRAWLAELFTGEELNYIVENSNCREDLLKKLVSPKLTIPKINLRKWLQEIINNKESNTLTPRQFVGDFMDGNSDFVEEQIRELIAIGEIPGNRSRLQSEAIKIGSLTFQHIIVAWPKSEEQLDAGVNLCLLLIPLGKKYLPEGLSLAIQQSPFPDEIHNIPELEPDFDLILERDLDSDIKIVYYYEDLTCQQDLICREERE
ncbi:hypothetical protein NIES208_03975 [[Limnothrix rosea] IAM M-220]|nr:hypothetical protein NIES208_03975 [[Limnothrix rosea] IAM M-220]